MNETVFSVIIIKSAFEFLLMASTFLGMCLGGSSLLIFFVLLAFETALIP